MKLKVNLRFFLTLLVMLASGVVMAQKTVTGIVLEPDGITPCVGVTVMQVGTNVGTATDIDGKFTIKVRGKNPRLQFSFVGMTPQIVAVKDRTELKVTMEDSSTKLDEVVVTALGISREQKSLGYAVSKIDGDEINNTQNSNWLNNLNGKVAGLTMSNAATGPMGSLRVTLRGDQSLNYGANEALFVVDGVPIISGDPGTGSGYSTSDDSPVDFGNGASELNPEDIESVSVLKGPAASALYGSRAANGAIIITTKSGRKEKGVGVTLSSSVTWEKAGFFPDFQKEYGAGSDLGFQPYAFWTFKNMETPEGFPSSANGGAGAWGEAYGADKLRSQYKSYNWETGEWTLYPYLYADDWYTGFLKTGVTFNNNVTVSSNNGNGTSARLSMTDSRNSWIIPNTGFQNQTVSFSFNTQISKWIKFNAKVNYLHKSSDNVPVTGYNNNNPFYLIQMLGTSVHPSEYWEEYVSGRVNYENYSTNRIDGVGMISRMGNTLPFNPYRQMYEATNAINKDRVYGNVQLVVSFPVDGLTLRLRGGMDLNTDWRQQKKPKYSPGFVDGFYREQNNRDLESNVDFLLQYQNNKLVGNRFSITAAFGGNAMNTSAYRNSTTLEKLGEEGVYNTTNLPEGENPRIYNYRWRKAVNSFYGFVNMSWDNTYFLDVTARNDWSSALAPGHWSFFYPSVSASVLLDRVLNFKQNAAWVDMLKLRASWANVGNDTSPYTLVDSYTASSNYVSSFLLPTTASNYYIKPENVESYEIGLQTMFLLNRIGFDLTYYNSATTNQIVSAVSDMITGSSYRKINCGKISNQGIELSIHAVPVQTHDFTWTVDLNWSRNWNKLVALEDGWDPSAAFIQNSGAGNSFVTIRSYLGEEMNWIYGRGYKRAPEGSFYMDANGNKVDCSGMKLINPVDGMPYLDDSADTRIAKVNPTWKGGMTTSLRYRDFTLGLTFTAQMGGHAFSHTDGRLTQNGKIARTLEGRYDGLLVEGVVATENSDGTISYAPNTTMVNNIYTYYQTSVARTNAEEHTFKTDFLKLTQARLDYNLPSRICRKTKVLRGASVGVYATNLFCITEFPQYDPEIGTLNGTNVVSGVEMGALPMTRTFGVNIKLSF